MLINQLYSFYIVMQSYSYQSLEQQDKQEYKQELGLRKMLYKYQHENEQLKNQIRALTQRLQSILSQKSNQGKQKQVKQSPDSKVEQAHTRYLNEQMNHYFKKIQETNAEIKYYKDKIDKDKELQYMHVSNELKDKQNKLQLLKSKIEKYKNELIQFDQNKGASVNNADQKQQQLYNKLSQDLQDLKKRVRQLQKTRNNNLKQDINRQIQLVNLQTKTRKINNPDRINENINAQEQSGRAKKGLWGMDLTQENYNKIIQELEQLKRQKNNIIQSIKVENNGLKQKLAKLKNQYIDLSNSSNINVSMDLSLSKVSRRTPLKQNAKDTIVLPDIPNPLGNSAYQRKNDKNFVPKKVKLIQWNVSKNRRGMPGFSWNDENNKSPITGINLWLDKQLIGLQFIHTLGQSVQHIHSEGGQMKKMVPIQYRLNSNDYLQNIVLVISKIQNKQQNGNGIVGLQLLSKNGRKDSFGLKIGTQNTQKYDFGILAPEKPIYSFGSFTINSSTHVSCINSLGFAVI